MSDSGSISDKDKEAAQAILMEVSRFVVSLARESERVAVVMGVAQVDLTLERSLKSLFREHPGGQDNLFDLDRPLSTFSAKIALAFRIGLIDSDFEHVLQMFRKIRNDFAHSTEPEKLTESRHRNRMKEIVNVMKSSPSFESTRNIFLNAKLSSPELTDFSVAIDMTLIILETTMVLNQRISHAKVASFKLLEQVFPSPE
jgi:DNA-binding MltR family transcriptional regulator